MTTTVTHNPTLHLMEKVSLVGLALIAGLLPIIFYIAMSEFLLTILAIYPVFALFCLSHQTLTGKPDWMGNLTPEACLVGAVAWGIPALYFLYGIFADNVPYAYVYFISMSAWVAFFLMAGRILRKRGK